MNKKRIEFNILSLKSYEICIAYANSMINVSASLPVPT